MNTNDLRLLNRRVERLNEEIELNASACIIKLELSLILDAVTKLLQNNKK